MMMDVFDDNGQLREECVDDILMEVVSGKHIFISDEIMYAIVTPSNDQLDQSHVVYRRALHEATRRGLPLRHTLYESAIENELLEPDDLEEKAALQKMLEESVRARETTTSPQQKLQLDQEMLKLREEIATIEVQEEELLRHSAEGCGESHKVDYLTFACTMGDEFLNKPIWEEWEEYKACTRTQLLLDSREAYLRASRGLPSKIIRALARTNEWRARWKAAKDAGVSPFSGIQSMWDRNKVHLAYWSDFYDSVYSHPERPHADVIQNDDLLQEWINDQLAKQKKQKGPGTPAGVRPVTYRSGGTRKTMQYLGQERHDVSQPYRVRTGKRK